MIQEFKDFVSKGGVVEAAIGLVFALAFQPVIETLVSGIVMPIIGRVFGSPDFSNITIPLGGEKVEDPITGEMIEASLKIGELLNTVISFIIVAFVLFLMIKAYNKAMNKEDEEEGPTETDLLAEIRDQLKGRPNV